MDIKNNLYLNGIFVSCSTLAGGTIAGLNTLNVGTGAAVGLVGSLVVVGGLALWDSRATIPPSKQQKKRAVGVFEFSRSNSPQQTIAVRGWKDLFGLTRQKTTLQPIARPVELDEWQFGSFTRSGRPLIFSERELFRFFKSIQRCSEQRSNLSRRYHVERVRSVQADLFDAIVNFIGFTQFKTGVQLAREWKHQHYALNTTPRRAFILMCYVEHCERRQGRGAPAMNTVLYQRFGI